MKPLPASSVNGWPGQMAVGPVIDTAGAGFTVMFVGAEVAAQPPGAVTVTV